MENKRRVEIAFVILMAASVFIYFALGNKVIAGCLIVIVFLGLGGILSAMSKQERKVQDSEKYELSMEVAKDIIAEEIEIIEYLPTFGINPALRKECGILPPYKYTRGNDYIKGKYKGVEFTFCDLQLKAERRYHKGKQEDLIMFLGHLINLSMKEYVDGYIRIFKRVTTRSRVNRLNAMHEGLKELAGNSSEEVIETGNEYLDMNYRIVTNNRQMSYMIMSPEFIERLCTIMKVTGEHTNIEIRGNEMFIAIDNSNDLFMVVSEGFGNEREKNARRQYRNDVRKIVEILDKTITGEGLFGKI